MKYNVNAYHNSLPVGTWIGFAGTTPPTGFLLCDGSAVSRATYSALFTEIGTTYGAGDGSTTFNVPNFTNRFPLGAAGAAQLGQTGGSDSAVADHYHTFAKMTNINNGYFLGNGSLDTKETPNVKDGTVAWRWNGSGSDSGAITRDGENMITSKGVAVSSTAKTLPPYIKTNYIIKY